MAEGERSGGWALPSLESTWLLVGVVSCGVISWGLSSSDESSSPRFSNCSCNCRSFSLAASISARWAASLASFSFASFSAACFLRFSSCFLTLPCLTCSSRALSRACEASRSFSSSSSWRRASFLVKIVNLFFLLHRGYATYSMPLLSDSCIRCWSWIACSLPLFSSSAFSVFSSSFRLASAR